MRMRSSMCQASSRADQPGLIEVDGAWLPFASDMGDARSPSVWALGLTFADHIQETGERAGAPVVFAKPCATAVGASEVFVPTQSDLMEALGRLDAGLLARLTRRMANVPALLDYEVEVGMVLLEDWRAPADAASAVMPRVGFFLANDVTARSVQIAGLGAGQGDTESMRYWSASKGFAGFLPVTASVWCPTLAHAEAWPDVTLSTRVNGVLRQHAPMRALLYSPLQILICAVQHAPDGILHRHDVVLAGTPAGIALQVPAWKRKLAACLPCHVAISAAWRSQKQSPRFLQPGDVIDMQAGWLGRLQITVRSRS